MKSFCTPHSRVWLAWLLFSGGLRAGRRHRSRHGRGRHLQLDAGRWDRHGTVIFPVGDRQLPSASSEHQLPDREDKA